MAEYEAYANCEYSNKDINTIKGIIATNIGKRLLEDNLIEFYKIPKGKTTIWDIYAYRGEVKVVKYSSISLKYKQLGKAVIDGLNEGLKEVNK